jgi:Tfp pilus assembly protein PilZ
MKVLKTNIRDPEALGERLLEDFQHAGLFVPQTAGLTVSEPVCLWIQIKSLDVELHLYGTVFWVRRRSGAMVTRLRSGAGIGFRGQQEATVRFLRQIAEGKSPPVARRRARRTPLLTPWQCVITHPTSGATRRAQIADMSTGGLRCQLPDLPVQEGEELELRFPWRSEVPQPMRAVWVHRQDGNAHMGFERLPTTRAPTREWRRLVRQARHEFQAHIWTRSSAEAQGASLPSHL